MSAPSSSTSAPTWLGEAPAAHAWELAWIAASVERRLFGASPAPAMIGRYELVGRLGTGGMGEVFAARDPVLERDVAIKLVAAPHSSDGRVDSRVLREAQVLARLSHPNIVTCYDAGIVGDVVFFAMELVEGEPMPQWLAAGRSRDEILDAFRDVASGLAAAHAAGIVHRDVKPSNVVIDRRGRARLLDFGLAILTVGGGDGRSIHGTPAYMAPEQHDGGSVDRRTDVYGLCVALFEGLCGEPPFVADTVEEFRAAKQHDEPGRGNARFAALDRQLRELIVRGLQPDPAARWPDVEAVLDRIVRARHGRRTLRWSALALGIGLVAAASAWSLARADGDACLAAAREIETVWNPEIAAELSATGDPDTAAIVTEIDERVAAWAQLRTASCRAANEVPESLTRASMRCLDVRALDLAAAVSVLQETAAAERGRARRIVDDLPPADECADAIVARRSPPESDNETVTLLARARAHEVIGHTEAAFAHATDAVASATAADSPSMLAWSLATRGRFALGTHRLASAREDLRAAALAVATSDDFAVRAEVHGHLASLEMLDRNMDAASWWTDLAEAELRELGSPPRATVSLLLKRVWIEIAAGRATDAVATADRAAAILDANGTEASYRGLEVLVARAEARVAAGDLETARADLERAVEIARSEQTREPVLVGATLQRLGLLALDEGRLDEAEAALHESLRSDESTYGARDSHVIPALSGLGDVARIRGDLEQALLRYRETVDVVVSAAEATGDLYTVLALTDFAEMALALGDVETAHARLVRARGVAERVVPDQIEHARVLSLLARTERARGHADEADRLREQARARLSDRTTALAALTAMTIALDLRDAGQTAAACEQIDRATELASATVWRSVVSRASVSLSCAAAG